MSKDKKVTAEEKVELVRQYLTGEISRADPLYELPDGHLFDRHNTPFRAWYDASRKTVTPANRTAVFFKYLDRQTPPTVIYWLHDSVSPSKNVMR